MLPSTVRDLLEVSVETEKPVKFYREEAKTALAFISGFQRPIAFCPDCNAVTRLEQKDKEWVQKCEDCGKTWGHYSYVQWRKQRNFREKERKMHVCPKCGNTRWKTKVMGESWVCRKCGTEITKPKIVIPIS